VRVRCVCVYVYVCVKSSTIGRVRDSGACVREVCV